MIDESLDHIVTSALALRPRTLDEALRDLVDLLHERFVLARASVRVIEGESIRIAALWSAEPTQLSVGTKMSRFASSWPEIAHMGGPVRSGEGASSVLNDILRTEGIRSWISIPLRSEGETVALLSFSSRLDDVFGDDLLPFFEVLGAGVEKQLCDLLAAEL